MSPRVRSGSDVLTFQTHVRTWIQEQQNPAHALQLFSLFGIMSSLDEPRGTGEPVYRYDNAIRRAYRKVGESIAAPDTYTTSFQEGMPRATANFLEGLRNAKKRFAMHNIVSQDAAPEDPSVWESKLVVEGLRLTNFSTQPFGAFDDDAEVFVSAEAEYEASGRVFPLSFGEEASSQVTTEVTAIAVYPGYDDADDGNHEIYAVTKADLSNPYLVWSHDGGVTWTATALSGIGTNDVNDVVVIGNYVIMVSSAGELYAYCMRSDPTTVTVVTSGFVATKGPVAIWGDSVANIFMAGLGGYIYKLTLPGSAVTVLDAGVSTTQDLNDIDGYGDTIVAVGASNAVVVSRNGGNTWTSLTGPNVGAALNAISVRDTEQWLVGSDTLHYTLDGGDSWTEKPLSVSGLTTINAIAFSGELQSCGLLAYTAGGAGGLLRTTDFGATWESTSLKDVPSCQAYNAVAFDSLNKVVVGGLGSGSDGILAIGQG